MWVTILCIDREISRSLIKCENRGERKDKVISQILMFLLYKFLDKISHCGRQKNPPSESKFLNYLLLISSKHYWSQKSTWTTLLMKNKMYITQFTLLFLPCIFLKALLLSKIYLDNKSYGRANNVIRKANKKSCLTYIRNIW